ncbi:MAG: ArsA family ATPase [Deltaproteobacteria bacterium]|nr:ArsA family ATPase [Deltaproteobacteria bacterium]
MSYPEIIFFLGKGGVGKSTGSAILSILLSQAEKKVLLASFDYAHNQSDIFQKNFSDKPTKINPNLEVLQINRDKEVKKYLSKTTKDVKKSFTYLTSFNLEGYFDVLKFSPGMEEYALVTTFMNIREKYKDYDYHIIDMPPTAVSLRFFNLPSLSLTWIDQLEKLRMEIYKKKEIVSKIKFAGKEIEKDKVLLKIREIKKDYLDMKGIFESNTDSSIYTVFNSDLLSVNETSRIVSDLSKLNINTKGFICNDRSGNEEVSSDLKTIERYGKIKSLPFSKEPLIGEAKIKEYIQKNSISIENILF